MFAETSAIGISIHSLRGEGDLSNTAKQSKRKIFQSTPSVGRETTTRNLRQVLCLTFQSTPSVGRETVCNRRIWRDSKISIHSLRGEGDSADLSGFEATAEISIHSLRGEGDKVKVWGNRGFYNFNPLPPWGGRQQDTCCRCT